MGCRFVRAPVPTWGLCFGGRLFLAYLFRPFISPSSPNVDSRGPNFFFRADADSFCHALVSEKPFSSHFVDGGVP